MPKLRMSLSLNLEMSIILPFGLPSLAILICSTKDISIKIKVEDRSNYLGYLVKYPNLGKFI